MLSRLHLSTIVLIATLLWGSLLLLKGVAINAVWFQPFPTVVGGLVLALAAFDLWLWRISWLHGWFVQRPCIRGTWRANLQSEWIDPVTGFPLPPIEAYIVIRQTYSRLSMRLITEESASEMLGSEMVRSADGMYQVAGIYRNEPRLSVRGRSPIHYGAVLLRVEGDPPIRLTGHYWTDRNSRGEVLAADHTVTIFVNFDAAHLGFPAVLQAIGQQLGDTGTSGPGDKQKNE